MQKHNKIRNVPFPHPCGATGMLRENFMHWHLCMFAMHCSCMKFYAYEIKFSALAEAHVRIIYGMAGSTH